MLSSDTPILLKYPHMDQATARGASGHRESHALYGDICIFFSELTNSLSIVSIRGLFWSLSPCSRWGTDIENLGLVKSGTLSGQSVVYLMSDPVKRLYEIILLTNQ